MGVIAGGALWVALTVARSSHARTVDIFAGLLAFCAGSMVLAAIGRSLPFPGSWSAPRYQSPVLLFWACLLSGWLARAGGRTPTRRVATSFIALATAIWVGSILYPAHLVARTATLRHSSWVDQANLAITLGIPSSRSYWNVLPFSEQLRMHTATTRQDSVATHRNFLERRQLGPFTDPLPDLIGKRLDELATPGSHQRCAGQITDAALIEPGLRWSKVKGWARYLDSDARPLGVLLADQHGTIVGIGKPPRGFRSPREGIVAGIWSGFANVFPAEPLRVAGLINEGTLCVVGTAAATRGVESRASPLSP